MKKLCLLLICLFSVGVYGHDTFDVDYELTYHHSDPAYELGVSELKSLLLNKAIESCRFRDQKGKITRLSDWNIEDLPERDLNDNPLCHWRGSCYIPKSVKISATFRCSFQLN